MTTLVLASFGTWLLTIPLVGVSLLLIGLVLLQKNRGSGLSGAFGGVGGNSAFGAKTGDFMTWLTVCLTAVFLLLSVVGNFVFEPGKTTAAQSVVAPGPGDAATGTDESAPVDAAPAEPPSETSSDDGSASEESSPPADPGAAQQSGGQSP